MLITLDTIIVQYINYISQIEYLIGMMCVSFNSEPNNVTL